MIRLFLGEVRSWRLLEIYRARLGFSTDSRKKLVLNIYINGTKGLSKSSDNTSTGIELSYKPTDYISVTLNPAYSKSFTELQYVSTVENNLNNRYIFASIDRKTISTSFRVNLNLSPNLTFQYWGQPFIATGRYYDYKYIVDPMADKYSDRFSTYTSQQITRDGDNYNIDENSDGTTDYTFERKDFNVQEFLSNLVIRWEYNPGSSVYLVWSQTRSSSSDSGNMDLISNLGDLFNTSDNKPHNVFLIKFSYRFGLK